MIFYVNNINKTECTKENFNIFVSGNYEEHYHNTFRKDPTKATLGIYNIFTLNKISMFFDEYL